MHRCLSMGDFPLGKYTIYEQILCPVLSEERDLFVKLRRDPKHAQPLQWSILNSWDEKKPSILSGAAAARFSHVRSHIHVDDGIKPMLTVMTITAYGSLQWQPPQSTASVTMVCASYFTFSRAVIWPVAWLLLTWPLVFWRECAVPIWNVCLSLPNPPAV